MRRTSWFCCALFALAGEVVLQHALAQQADMRLARPSIVSVSASHGPVGSTISIHGSNFTSDNSVHFGIGGAMHIRSQNGGTLIYYTIPRFVSPCDFVEDRLGHRCMAPSQPVTPGTYGLYVSNTHGETKAQKFEVTSN